MARRKKSVKVDNPDKAKVETPKKEEIVINEHGQIINDEGTFPPIDGGDFNGSTVANRIAHKRDR